MNQPFEIRGFNMCESLLRHTPQQLSDFLDRMNSLKFNNLIVQYDYGFRHYQNVIREKCEKYNIDVTLMVFGPRTFFSLSNCPAEYFACDENGKPYCPSPECETWPCFNSAGAMEYFKRGAEIFLKECVPSWIKRVHMRSGDGWWVCDCPKCRNVMPSVGWHPYIKAFAEILKRVRPDLESESDIYVGRYDTNVAPEEYADVDCVMYDTFGHHPRIAIGDNPNQKSNWIPVHGRDTDEFNCNSLYHLDRLTKWAKRLPGKIYIHDNTMMQSFVGNFSRNTQVMFKDLALYRKLNLRGVLFEAYEPGYCFFEKHFEHLAKAMLDPEYAAQYKPTDEEKMFMNIDLNFSFIDGGTSPELLELLEPEEREYITLCDKGLFNPTVESYRALIDYTIDHQDKVDVCFVGNLATKRAIRVSKNLDFSNASDEAKKLLSYNKLWDYMEQCSDHSAARDQVIELIKNLRDSVK